MPRQPQWARTTETAVLAAMLAVTLGACGPGRDPGRTAKADRALKQCRAQWRDVGASVLGMDRETDPSALAERWNSVIATVDYYRSTDTAKDCRARVETQLRSVSELRQFSEKLRPYDMTYQLAQVRAAVDLYLNDPLPSPVRNDRGKLVPPPAKPAVRSAIQTLTANAAAANTELEPGWAQAASVDLTDATAVTKTMKDLDFLAQDSPHWRQCEAALQVIVAAIRAQEGLSGSASRTPSGAPTDATTP